MNAAILATAKDSYSWWGRKVTPDRGYLRALRRRMACDRGGYGPLDDVESGACDDQRMRPYSGRRRMVYSVCGEGRR